MRQMTRSEGTVGEWNEVLWCCPSLRLDMPDARLSDGSDEYSLL